MSGVMLPIIVVGGGAAGLLAAGTAAARGQKVVLVEKGPALGAKILISGGGRCNFSHTGEPGDHAAAFGRQGRFLRSAYARFFTDDLRSMLAVLGVPSRIESDGRIFPTSGRAADVEAALEHWVRSLGVDVRLNTAVLAVETTDVPAPTAPVGPPFDTQSEIRNSKSEIQKPHAAVRVAGVRTATGVLPARAAIVCVGGRTYPRTGTTGDGYAIAEALGHSIVPCLPVLAGLHATGRLCASMQGVSLANAQIQAFPLPESWPAGSDPQSETHDPKSAIPRVPILGPVLFTHFGVSGPAILDMSRHLAEGFAAGSRFRVVIDLLAEDHRPPDALVAGASRQQVNVLVRALLPDKMAEPLLRQARIEPDKVCNQLTREERQRLDGALHRLAVTVTGSEGWDRAMVTRGGVSLREVDSSTLQSRLVRGLHFAGEILDLDGATGGYNLQAAFSMGCLAGRSA